MQQASREASKKRVYSAVVDPDEMHKQEVWGMTFTLDLKGDGYR